MRTARSPLPLSDALRPASGTPQRENFKHDSYHAGGRSESTIEKLWSRVLKAGGFIGVFALFTLLLDCLLLLTRLGGQAHHPFTYALLTSFLGFGIFGYTTWLRKQWGEMGLPESGTLSQTNSALVIRDLYRFRSLLAGNAGWTFVYFFVLTMSNPDKFTCEATVGETTAALEGEDCIEVRVTGGASVFYVFLLLLAFAGGMYSAMQAVKVSRLREAFNGEWSTNRQAEAVTDIEWEPGTIPPSTPPQTASPDDVQLTTI